MHLQHSCSSSSLIPKNPDHFSSNCIFFWFLPDFLGFLFDFYRTQVSLGSMGLWVRFSQKNKQTFLVANFGTKQCKGRHLMTKFRNNVQQIRKCKFKQNTIWSDFKEYCKSEIDCIEAGELTQVIMSIPWVRWASGDVLDYFFLLEFLNSWIFSPNL